MKVSLRVALIAATLGLVVGCSQEGGSPDVTGESSENPKHFDPGPLLATTDAAQLGTLLDHHRSIIARRGYSYTVGDNPAVHRTEEELAGFERDDVVPKGDPEPVPRLYGDPPTNWDWRDLGVGLPAARDQASCGSCWAFATVATLEAAIAVFDEEIVDLSEQYILDCNPWGYGCGGGMYAHEMHLDGAVWERDMPYLAYQQRCAASSYERPYEIIRHGSVEAGNIEEIKAAIYQYGAVATSMRSCGSIPGYTGGIYDSTECNGGWTNHAVALVGWDDTVEHRQGRGVWIMRNSWGTRWGESGYMRAAYGVAQIGMVDVTFSEYEPIDPTDTDEDGVIDLRDNCPEAVNSDQLDSDLDGAGDACDSTFDRVVRDMTLSDDDSGTVDLGFTFPFYGQDYSSVHVNSDGNLTFGSADSGSETRDQNRFLTGPPRIGVLYADLNPSSGGSITFTKEDRETLTVTYSSVPEYSSSGSGGSNTAEVTIHSSGRISITVSSNTLTGTAPQCIVGITRGGEGNTETARDLSSEASRTIAYEGTSAVYEVFTGGGFDLTGTTISLAGTVEPNRTPVAAIDATPRSGDAPLEVVFTGNGNDEDGRVVAYHWDFDNGTVADRQDVSTVFQEEGEYVVTLTVTDDQGATGEAQTTIYVGVEAPPDDDPADDDPIDDDPTDDDPTDDDPGGGEGFDPAYDDPVSGMYGGTPMCSVAAATPGAGSSSDAAWLVVGLAGLAALWRRRRTH